MKKKLIVIAVILAVIAAFVIFFAMQVTPGYVLNQVRAQKLEVVDGTLTIPEIYTVIDTEAFSGKIDFDSLVIKGEAEIGERAFYGCPNLREIIIEKDCEIGELAFGDCPELIVVTIESSGGSCAENAFEGHKGIMIRCPEESPALLVAQINDMSYKIIGGSE